ncbi:MAG: hybrid sensor histidine kinase/response regulator [Prochlorotrichaceae cyanobacterium]|jgi:signal transduction histidine kinase
MSQPSILIVDDTLDNLHLLATLLKQRDYEIRKAINGQMAIESIQSDPPDLILLDIMLPDLSGYEVCQFLKTQTEYQNIPIIFISALDAAFDKVRAFECGGVDYITKPFFISEVIARIENQLTLKNLQSQLLKQNQQLEEEISHRKQAEQEILKNLLQEQELNRLKSQFVSIISHEFKTPLATIQLATDLLSNYNLDPEQRAERYKQIESSIFYMNSLLESAIFTENLDNKTISLGTQTVNFNDFFNEIIETLKETLTSSHELITTIQGEIPTIKIETTLIGQILSNLISNAIKYSPKGGKVLVDLTYESGKMILRVQDSGIGIPVRDQDQLFQLFSRGSNISNIRGTGLGLTIVQKAVQLLQGDLTFTSAVGVGTEMVVTIPYHLPTNSLDSSDELHERSDLESFPSDRVLT